MTQTSPPPKDDQIQREYPDIKYAVVTGATRGIGRELCRLLCDEHDYRVIGTYRTEGLRDAAQEYFGKRNVQFLHLDVTHPETFHQFARELKAICGDVAIDVFVNNAGVQIDGWTKANYELNYEVNLMGPIKLLSEIRPLMCKGSVIVNVTSGLGTMSALTDKYRKVIAKATRLEDLFELHNGFDENDRSQLEPESPFRISKAALNKATAMIEQWYVLGSIYVKAVCPGWCSTGIGGPDAPRTAEQGARGILEAILKRETLALFTRDGVVFSV